MRFCALLELEIGYGNRMVTALIPDLNIFAFSTQTLSFTNQKVIGSIPDVVDFSFVRFCLKTLFEIGYGNRMVAALIPDLIFFAFLHTNFDFVIKRLLVRFRRSSIFRLCAFVLCFEFEIGYGNRMVPALIPDFNIFAFSTQKLTFSNQKVTGSISEVVDFSFVRFCLKTLFEIGYGNCMVAGLIPDLVVSA